MSWSMSVLRRVSQQCSWLSGGDASRQAGKPWISLDATFSSANSGYGDPEVVLIGDHAQLPATVLSKAASHEGLSTSLFERMAARLDFIASALH